MTSWLPNLSEGAGPLYLRLAERIERDIERGVLTEGTKLPPQRNLAFDVGVTLGTVSRAYAVARERGLVNGEVGRGTYVLRRAERHEAVAGHAIDIKASVFADSAVNATLRMDSTAAADVGQAGVIGPMVAEVFADFPHHANDYTRTIRDEWREAGAHWLTSGGWRPSLDTIVPAQGVLSGIESVIGAVTAPGDRVAFEDLSYSALARGAALIGRRPITVQGGNEGIDPDDFQAVCAREHPKALVLSPTFNNPTMSIMPVENRQRIAEIARRYNVLIVEDNIYGDALDDGPPPFAAIIPEQTFHVSGVSKTLSAGLRAGWVSCPPNLAGRLVNAKKLLTGGISFAMTEVTARLVLSGEADRLKTRVLEETRTRAAIASEIMAGYSSKGDPHCGFIWLKLPDPWLPGTFKKAALERGILIDDADAFKVGQVDLVCHCVRIGFTAPRTRGDVRRGLESLAQLLHDTSAGYDSME
ncbi:MAG: PLP-dependent aminotransferase family protein [Propylenella sp.]